MFSFKGLKQEKRFERNKLLKEMQTEDLSVAFRMKQGKQTMHSKQFGEGCLQTRQVPSYCRNSLRTGFHIGPLHTIQN